jgi:RNA polymerase sigma-70 factor, ECF subfamily
MASPGSLTGLFDDLCSPHLPEGDAAAQAMWLLKRDAAAQAIWDRFTADLLALCGRSLSQRIRVKADPEEVVQSAYQSFFKRQARGQFDLKDRHELWNLLVTITLRKARNLANHYTAALRDIAREQPQGEEESDEGGTLPAPMWMLTRMDRSEPTPAEAALFNEEFELRLVSLPEGLRQIALWKLEGYTNQEIAAQIGRTERTVENELSRIRRRWTPDGDTAAAV